MDPDPTVTRVASLSYPGNTDACTASGPQMELPGAAAPEPPDPCDGLAFSCSDMDGQDLDYFNIDEGMKSAALISDAELDAF